jgi:hypothetical protein
MNSSNRNEFERRRSVITAVRNVLLFRFSFLVRKEINSKAMIQIIGVMKKERIFETIKNIAGL